MQQNANDQKEKTIKNNKAKWKQENASHQKRNKNLFFQAVITASIRTGLSLQNPKRDHF